MHNKFQQSVYYDVTYSDPSIVSPRMLRHIRDFYWAAGAKSESSSGKCALNNERRLFFLNLIFIFIFIFFGLVGLGKPWPCFWSVFSHSFTMESLGDVTEMTGQKAPTSFTKQNTVCGISFCEHPFKMDMTINQPTSFKSFSRKAKLDQRIFTTDRKIFQENSS